MALTASHITADHAAEDRPVSYRAAVVRDFEAPLSIAQVPAAQLEAGQIRVTVEASGLCHTDIQRGARRLADQAVAALHSRP